MRRGAQPDGSVEAHGSAPLLDAERTQLQAEDAVAQAESGVIPGVVAVYKAFGASFNNTRSAERDPARVVPFVAVS